MSIQQLQYYVHDERNAFRLELAGSLTGRGVQSVYQAWQTALSIIGDAPWSSTSHSSPKRTNADAICFFCGIRTALALSLHHASLRLSSNSSNPLWANQFPRWHKSRVGCSASAPFFSEFIRTAMIPPLLLHTGNSLYRLSISGSYYRHRHPCRSFAH
jgi:hypothetical protein